MWGSFSLFDRLETRIKELSKHASYSAIAIKGERKMRAEPKKGSSHSIALVKICREIFVLL